MGRALIEAVAHSETDIAVSVATVLADDPTLGVDVGLLAMGSALGVESVAELDSVRDEFDVLIDFTAPDATLQHLALCQQNCKAMVIGTTGFSESQQQLIANTAEIIPVVLGTKRGMGGSLGVELRGRAGRVLGDDVDMEISEAHHGHKKGAPSGTALKMGEIVAQVLGRDLQQVALYGREGVGEERDRKTIGFSTIRAGDIVGEHTIIFAGLGERVEITHKASSRMTFANGAVRAANWIADKDPGLYSMQDVLNL